MSNYIFTYPAGTPPMTFEELSARLNAVCNHYRNPRCTSCTARIGTTITLRWHTADRSSLAVILYETTIAVLTSDETVRFPNDDPHRATSMWIEKIVQDNGIGQYVGRVRRRKADGLGPELNRGRAGLHVIDWNRDKPVHGRVYLIDRERMAAQQDANERWAAEMTYRDQNPDQWYADLKAAQPGEGMPDYRGVVDPKHWRNSRHRPDLCDIR